jgi:hypothetical protein
VFPYADLEQQCRADATHVCRDRNGFEWFACERHAGYVHEGHRPTRKTPIAEWFANAGIIT